MDISLKVSNVEKFEIPTIDKIKTLFRFNNFLKRVKENETDCFIETLIVDEILEVEDGKK